MNRGRSNPTRRGVAGRQSAAVWCARRGCAASCSSRCEWSHREPCAQAVGLRNCAAAAGQQPAGRDQPRHRAARRRDALYPVHGSASAPRQGPGPSRATGFRFLQVRTAAQVAEIERILVDDQEISFSATYEPDEGFDVNLWRHIEQTGDLRADRLSRHCVPRLHAL